MSDLVTVEYLRTHLAQMVDRYYYMGCSQNSVARNMGISAGHLSRLLSGEKEPGPKVLEYLGFEEVKLYRLTKPQSVKGTK